MIANAIVAAATVASLAGDPGLARLEARAEACIAANVTEVERAEAGLLAATDFLVNDVCGVPVSLYQRYSISLQLLAAGRRSELYGDYMADMQRQGPAGADPAALAQYKEREKQRRDAYSRATISEESGEIEMTPKSDAFRTFINNAPGRASAGPELRAFAAKALLSARRTRSGR